MDRPSVSQFIIRPYQHGDEVKINEMFNEVFHQDRSLNHWYWKYRENPYGSHRIALAIAPDGRLAAHYGGYPVRFILNSDKGEKEFVAHHLGDKMTRKEYRGIGFGRNALLTLTFREFQRSFGNDAFFGYGFGTHHSLRFGLLFLDYVDIEPVHYWKANINELRHGVKVSSLMRPLSMQRVRPTKWADMKWDIFLSRVAPSYRFLVKRDSEYINWRYLKRPDRRYHILTVERWGRLKGWSVFFRDGNRLIWGDGLFEPNDIESLRVLLMSLISSSYCDGCITIEGWFSNRPLWWSETLKSLGFKAMTEPSNLHLTGPIKDKEALSLVRNDLYYTMGDSDLF